MTEKLKFEAPRKAMAMLAGIDHHAGTNRHCPRLPPPNPRPRLRIRRLPIKHLVVIFDENVSFDHYFGTYPFARPILAESRIRCCSEHSYGKRSFERAVERRTPT